eukprot:gene4401-3877_t
MAVEVRPYIDHELIRQYGRLLRLRQQLPFPLALTVFDKRDDHWGCTCRHLAREVYREHSSDSKYYADVSAAHGARAERFYGFRAGPPRPYVILKWKDVRRGRPIVSYFGADRKGRLRSVAKILDRLLRERGRSPDVWSVPDAVARLRSSNIADGD